MRDLIKKLYAEQPIGKDVTIKGWVRSQRTSKSFTFIVLNDGSCQKDIQIVADDKLAGYSEFIKCGTGCSLAIKGKLVASQGKQPIEVQATEVEILGLVAEDY